MPNLVFYDLHSRTPSPRSLILPGIRSKNGCPQLPASKGVGGRPDATMAPQISQVAPKEFNKTYVLNMFAGPGTTNFPNRFRLNADRCVVDLLPMLGQSFATMIALWIYFWWLLAPCWLILASVWSHVLWCFTIWRNLAESWCFYDLHSRTPGTRSMILPVPCFKVVDPNCQRPQVSAVAPTLQWHPKSDKWRQRTPTKTTVLNMFAGPGTNGFSESIQIEWW